MKSYQLIFIFLICQIGFSKQSSAQDWDWPELNRYRDANEKLESTPTRGDQVVYMGDSITDFWIDRSPGFFTGDKNIDRGINSQTSPQMLLRFRADVISLKPKAVVILCGTNDIARPSKLDMIEDNIATMAELAKVHKIKVILCSVLPTSDFEKRPAEKIITLNTWIKNYAKHTHCIYLDYYSSFVDENKGMKTAYTQDGLHPNAAGYQVMENLLQPVLQKL